MNTKKPAFSRGLKDVTIRQATEYYKKPAFGEPAAMTTSASNDRIILFVLVSPFGFEIIYTHILYFHQIKFKFLTVPFQNITHFP